MNKSKQQCIAVCNLLFYVQGAANTDTCHTLLTIAVVDIACCLAS